MLSNRWLQGTKINFVDVPQLVRFPRALEDQRLPLNGNDKCHQSYKTIPLSFFFYYFDVKFAAKWQRFVALEEKLLSPPLCSLLLLKVSSLEGIQKVFHWNPYCHCSSLFVTEVELCTHYREISIQYWKKRQEIIRWFFRIISHFIVSLQKVV